MFCLYVNDHLNDGRASRLKSFGVEFMQTYSFVGCLFECHQQTAD